MRGGKINNTSSNEQARLAAQRRRNWAIFLAVIGLAVLFFIMTILRTKW